MKQIILKETFDATPEELYNAFLTSKTHSEMTGGKAICSSEINGTFSAWDGYITGYNISLEPYKRIVQAWRTTEFSEADKDSEVIIQFEKVEDGCFLTLTHNNIPEGQADYKKGWIEYYFTPMKQYFK